MVVLKPASRMCAIHASQQAQVGVLKTVRLLDGRVWAQAVAGWPGDYRMGVVELIAMLVLTLVVAAAIHVLVEQPGRRWLRGRMAPQRADPIEAKRSVHSDQGEPF